MSIKLKQVDTYRVNLVQKGKNMQCPGCKGETFLPSNMHVHRRNCTYLCETKGCTSRKLKVVKGEFVKQEVK